MRREPRAPRIPAIASEQVPDAQNGMALFDARVHSAPDLDQLSPELQSLSRLRGDAPLPVWSVIVASLPQIEQALSR